MHFYIKKQVDVYKNGADPENIAGTSGTSGIVRIPSFIIIIKIILAKIIQNIYSL